MPNIVRSPGWATINLNTQTGHIFVQETWHYHWTVEPGARPWTLRERRAFHNALDRQIWCRWSSGIQLQVRGTNPFVARFPRGLPVMEFDIRWVLAGGQWTVHVRKMPPGSTPTTFISEVLFASRVIYLDSADLDSYRPNNAHGDSRDFFAGPHEFGHTLPNAIGMGNPDEYRDPAAVDADSIMNIGRQVRAHHLAGVIAELNAMLPDCTFSA